jgi:hypothetical protein
MRVNIHAALLRRAGKLLAIGLTFMVFTTAQASANHKIIIVNDRGGIIQDRLRQIREFSSQGVEVELKGEVCLSSCTLFLALPNVCVSPNTKFGFHGPSSYGRPLPSKAFNYWSDVMARHYREGLKAWFMQTGRYRINGYYTIKGRNLAQYGYRLCGVHYAG